jgi:archaellum component FlaC
MGHLSAMLTVVSSDLREATIQLADAAERNASTADHLVQLAEGSRSSQEEAQRVLQGVIEHYGLFETHFSDLSKNVNALSKGLNNTTAILNTSGNRWNELQEAYHEVAKHVQEISENELKVLNDALLAVREVRSELRKVRRDEATGGVPRFVMIAILIVLAISCFVVGGFVTQILVR